MIRRQRFFSATVMPATDWYRSLCSHDRRVFFGHSRVEDTRRAPDLAHDQAFARHRFSEPLPLLRGRTWKRLLEAPPASRRQPNDKLGCRLIAKELERFSAVYEASPVQDPFTAIHELRCWPLCPPEDPRTSCAEGGSPPSIREIQIGRQAQVLLSGSPSSSLPSAPLPSARSSLREDSRTDTPASPVL